MSKIMLFLAVLFYFTGTVQAMAIINEETVKSAQTYGIASKDLPTGVLLSKWTVADSKKTNRFGVNERVIIYTPYAVAAVDAQDRAQSGQSIEAIDGIAIANAYEGILALGAIINSSFQVQPKDLTVHIYQGDKKVPPYNITLDKAVSHARKISRSEFLLGGKLQATKSEQIQPPDMATKKIKNAVLEASVSKDLAPDDIIIDLWDMQYFVYFDLTKINTRMPMILTIADQASGDREFKINLMDMN